MVQLDFELSNDATFLPAVLVNTKKVERIGVSEVVKKWAHIHSR